MSELSWNTIDELRNIFIKKYQDSELGSELEKACSEEYELVRDYNGRQILELLQNVDDACDETEKHTNKSKDVVVKIVFSGVKRVCSGKDAGFFNWFFNTIRNPQAMPVVR